MVKQQASRAKPKLQTNLQDSTAADKLSKRLGYEFRNPELLEQALTHGSFFYEQADGRDAADPALLRKDNERLEFLGDAVLGLLAAETLFAHFPNTREGVLTQMRAQLVSRKHLGDIATRLKLGAALRLGRGEERSGGRKKAVLAANALEAIAGAMFLDSGLDAVRTLFTRHIAADQLKGFATAVKYGAKLNDAKSALQEHLQAADGLRAEYKLLAEVGPDHDKKFTMQVSATTAGRIRTAKATRRTKKLAEQEAARKLLVRLVQKPVEACSE
jgi:ribonuclease-3